MPKIRLSLLAATAATLLAGHASAGSFTGVANGNFASNTANTTINGVNVGTNVTNSNVTGWSVTGCLTSCNPVFANTDTFTFLANTGTVGAAGVQATYADLSGNIAIYQAPGGTAPSTYAFTADAGNQNAALYQTISNLTVGDTYLLTFSQASMQAKDTTPSAFTGAWNIYFGTGNASLADSAATTTAVSTNMNNPAAGSTSWASDTIALTATATTETLSFFATASNGQPPFLLLDGVSLTDQGPASQTAVPEPASMAMLGAGALGMVLARRKRIAV